MSERFQDQYFSVMGDSISAYAGYIPRDYPSFYSYRDAPFSGIYGYRDTWWGQVIARLGGKLLVNNAWSGSYVSKLPQCEIESYGCSDARCAGLGVEGLSPDQIIVFLGSNDRGAGLSLSSDDKSDLSVFENAYGLMLDKIKQNYPNAEIWCCTLPITTCTRDPSFEFLYERAGVPVQSYNVLIQKTAEKRRCHVIDLWDGEHLCDTIEGLHPNIDGMCMIADKVIQTMESAPIFQMRSNLFGVSAPFTTEKTSYDPRIKEET